MKLGITGTRSGMSDAQETSLLQWMGTNTFDSDEIELHHGDCIGVDVEVAFYFKQLGYKIICHPPRKKDLCAFFPSDEVKSEQDYFQRNRNIVDEVNLLLVIPYQMERQNNGGTWYTYDYAKKKNKRIVLILRDGKIVIEQ